MKDILTLPGKEINLGKKGENLARRVVFNIKEWVDTYGEGNVQLLHQRNGDAVPYPCVVEVSGTLAFWTLRDADLDVAGRGRAELQYYVGDVRVKSATWNTRTDRALDNAGPEPEEPQKSWVEKILEAANTTEDNKEIVLNAANEAANAAQAAKTSEEAAAVSEQNAADSEAAAEDYSLESKGYADRADASAESAADSAKDAASNATASMQNATIAAQARMAASTSAQKASASARMARDAVAQFTRAEDELFPEQEIILGRAQGSEDGFNYPIPASDPNYSRLQRIEAGKEYRVVWDGEEYTCTAIDTSDSFAGIPSVVVEKVVTMGNLSYGGRGEDNGMPFVVEVIDLRTTTGGVYIQSAVIFTKLDTAAESVTRTVRIYAPGTIKIGDEFLSDNIATKEYVEEKLKDVDLSDYATKEFVQDQLKDVDVDLTGYATEQYVQDQLKNVDVDLSDYATKVFVTDEIEEALSEFEGGGEGGGIAGAKMVVEKNDITGAYELVLYDSDGKEVSRTVLPATGGGGGGNTGTYNVEFTNLLESRILSAPENTEVWLKFNYTSVDAAGNDDGKGVCQVWVNGVKKATVEIPQGEHELDVSGWLGVGSNEVKLIASNFEGISKTLVYTVEIVVLRLTTTINEYTLNTGETIFYYTPTGDGTKKVTFKMDGEEIGTAEVSSSGRSQSFTIPAQEHGGHIFECYAEVTVSGVTVKSNTLKLGMAWVDPNRSDAFILSTFSKDSVVQGDPLTITYLPYDPTVEQAVVTRVVLNEDGSVYDTKTVNNGRSVQEWAVQDYPVGKVKFRVAIGDIGIDLPVTVTESSIVIEPVTDGMVFEFNAAGRSNQEDNPAHWESGDVVASFSGVGFSSADGWLNDADGAPMLRLMPGGQMTIPFTLFSTDMRESGATVEVELATHNVRDYDSVVMSCLSNNRGFMIASQYAELNSEQSSVSRQFKEDEKVRVSFVVAPMNLHRLIYVYIDSVMCGAIQYPTDDNFAQSPAVGITIGAESSGIDVYRIRLYRKGLSRHEVLDNFKADQPTLAKRREVYNRNNIFDAAEDVVVTKLPKTLPYMIITCPELPQTKGDKKTCEITYVDPANPAKSFTAKGVEIDVQGTSSAGYKKKNWKIKYKNGMTLTSSGTYVTEYQLRENSIPANCFCMKADVASSESANNVELVRLYNDVVPHKTPPQLSNPNVRVGIDGLPCVIFWQNSDTGAVRFWGKYNFNDEKSSTQVYGLTSGCESWEIKNNTSNRVIFKSADFTGNDWQNDFEARYPDKNTDITRLKALCEWVVSTDRSAVSSEAEKAARLVKFKAEFEDHFVKAPMLFYYLFTEVFLMVDNRAKNFFPSTFDGVHWLPLPYDMDTAMGINNEGQLVFEYDLEDTDTLGNAEVFNGQESVLWCNIRDAFPDELKEMYADLRKNSVFSYQEVIKRWADHQQVWPEAIWNEDAWEKYLEPLENDSDGAYLTMLQGNKASQREWWVFNGFRYRDSKYQCADAEKNFITLRPYANGNISVTPYSHIWARIKYGSYVEAKRAKRNVETLLEFKGDDLNDTETYIYSSDRLSRISDLSPLHVGYANFTMAPKLQYLKLGDGAANYRNERLNELYVGTNDLLDELDIQNCPNLTMAVDMRGCIGLETVKAKGSSVSAITLPVGGRLKRLELPGTVKNLTLRDLKQFTTLDMEGYANITTLRIENTPNVPVGDILAGMTKPERVRLIDAQWTVESEAVLAATIDKLTGENVGGLDADGKNTDKAIVTGRAYTPSVSGELLERISENFPELVVVANGEPQYVVRYVDWNNTVLYRYVVGEGSSAIDPVAAGLIEAPTREGGEEMGYAFADFGTLPTNIHNNITLVARYTPAYRVRFMADGEVFDTQYVVEGGSATLPAGEPQKSGTEDTRYEFSRWDSGYTNITGPVDIQALFIEVYRVRFMVDGEVYNTQWVQSGRSATMPTPNPTRPSTAQYDFTFSSWKGNYTNITEPKDIEAIFTFAVRKYTVKWMNGSTLLETDTNVPYGTVPTYNGSEPVYTGEKPENYAFIGWNPAVAMVTGDATYTAVFKDNSIKFRKLIDRSISGEYSNSLVTKVGDSAFNGCTKITAVDFPSATSVGDSAFKNCTGLQSVDFPSATSVGHSAFENCTGLQSANLPAVTTAGNSVFRKCSNLITATIPKLTTLGGGSFDSCGKLPAVDFPELLTAGDNTFMYCNAITSFYFPKVNKAGWYMISRNNGPTSAILPSVGLVDGYGVAENAQMTLIDLASAYQINDKGLWNNYALTALILRRNAVCTLQHVDALRNTPIAGYQGKTGYIYVPSAQVDKYKAASNWSTLSAQFRALEDFTVDGTITGELDPAKI